MTRQDQFTPGEMSFDGSKTSRSLICTFWLPCLLATAFLAGCGADNRPSEPADNPVPVHVSINPSAITVPQGGSQSFAASVTGSDNTAVTWKVQEGAAGGAITSAGVYTAPAAPGDYHVVATSQADSTKSATATVNVPPISVTITPAAATVVPGGTQPFMATVTGTIDARVTWTIQEGAAGGTITNPGVYTAPLIMGFYHILANSEADKTASARAIVTVTSSSGRFTPTGNMETARGFHTATLLPSGKVLVAGGTGGGYGVIVGGQSRAELYDPAGEQFTPTSSLLVPRFGHTATLLPNGKVLVAGGFDAGVVADIDRADPYALLLAQPHKSAELYDPVAGTFMPTGSMKWARGGHTATLLPNGRVLIAGGGGEVVGDGSFPFFGATSATAELFDPSTETFSPTGSMSTPRNMHTATLLSNGKVLAAGGVGEGAITPTSELYDPATGTFTPTSSLGTARAVHTATLLPDGKVLILGGLNTSTLASVATNLASAELYDPTTGSFTSAGSMGMARMWHTAVLLPDGTVLIAGGAESGPYAADLLPTAELYDPETGLFAPTGNMEAARAGHTATLLPDGRVLVAGSNDDGGWNPKAAAELYE